MSRIVSKFKSAFDGCFQTMWRPQLSGDSTAEAKIEPATSADDGDDDWVEFPANFTSHLSFTITILYEQRDALQSIGMGFVVQLFSILDQECYVTAAVIAEMRSLNNTELRTSYDLKVVKEVTSPLDDIETCRDAVLSKIKRLQAPLDTEDLATNRLTNMLEIYDLFLACRRQLRSVNTILTRARRLQTPLEPVMVQKTSDLTLKLLFETCYEGAMMLTENRLEEKPDGWKLLNFAFRLRNWGDNIFEAKPFPLNELFALDPEGTQICRDMLVPNFLRILVYLERSTRARILRVTSGAEKVKNTGLKAKILEDLESQLVSINKLLNSTELLHYPVYIWGSDISFEDLMDAEDLKDSIANDVLDDEQQELLAALRARCGPAVSEFENAVNTLWNVHYGVIDKRRRLCEIKIDHPNHTVDPPKEVINAARVLQKIDSESPLPLYDLERGMHGFCTRQRTVSYTEREKAAAADMQTALSLFVDKHKAVEELLADRPDYRPINIKDQMLKEKLVLCILLSSVRTLKLIDAVDLRPAIKSGAKTSNLGTKRVQSNPPGQDAEDKDEDPDRIFGQMVAVLRDI